MKTFAKKLTFIFSLFLIFSQKIFLNDFSPFFNELNKNDLEQALQEASEQYSQDFIDSIDSFNFEENLAKDDDVFNKDGLIIFSMIIGSFVFSILFVIFFWNKQKKIYEGQFKDASSSFSFSFSSDENKSETLSYFENIKNSTVADELLEKINNLYSLSEEERESENDEQNCFILACYEKAKEIDEYTRRNMFCENVAQLVLRVSLRLGYSKEHALLFYCAALVYDIGFLKLDKQIFLNEKLTDDMFEIIKSHTEKGQKLIDFVPKKHKALFVDAILKHHENLNGSGYPNRLVNYEIPYIARVIRVVESYMAIITKQANKEKISTYAAISELKKQISHYDKKIINALEAII